MNIVAMGGGTGLSSLLHGLKYYVREDGSDQARPRTGRNSAGNNFSSGNNNSTENLETAIRHLTALVTVSDDGGSSGRLRREFQVLPPGDIRNCLVALSEDEALLSRLFQFRFASGRGLKGHSFGNLFLTALTGVMGDFQDAVRAAGEVLATCGCIFPSTNSDVHLEAVLEDGSIVRGETNISHSRSRIVRLRLVPPHCRPLPEAVEAIAEADVITVGPGSLFTSVIPNLLVRGMAKQMARSSAARIYICNLMTQPGETTNYTAADHLRAIYDHCKFPVFDTVLVNSKPASPALRKRYLAGRARPVESDIAELESLGVRVVEANLLSETRPDRLAPRRIRHHSERLARAVIEIASSQLRKVHGADQENNRTQPPGKAERPVGSLAGAIG